MDESDPLYAECLELLASTVIAEDERVEQVEQLVRDKVGSTMPNADVERLVLDLLWEHFEGVKRVRKTRIRDTTATKPIKLPAAAYEPDARAKLRQNAAPAKKKQWKRLDELDLPDKEPPAAEISSPYDMLREILGQDTSDEDIERVLAHNEFDIGRTIDMLLKTMRAEPEGEEEAKQRLLTRDQTAERVVCRYYLQSGSCLRGSDCMYSHDLSQRICRFWLQGRCMANESCVFLHQIPPEVVEKLNAAASPAPVTQTVPDFKALPKLGSKKPVKKATVSAAQPPALKTGAAVSALGLSTQLNRGLIPIWAPLHAPWKDPGFLDNQQYIDLRVSARKWADLRNKYLQLATNSWSDNDPATAKHMSKKGQEFNEMMLDDYEKARQLLLDQSTKPSSEVFVDLHGLELEDAIEFLAGQLAERNETTRHSPRVVYVVCGRGHYKQKRYVDHLSQQVVMFLDRHGYMHKGFGDDALFGRLIGVDPYSAIAT